MFQNCKGFTPKNILHDYQTSVSITTVSKTATKKSYDQFPVVSMSVTSPTLDAAINEADGIATSTWNFLDALLMTQLLFGLLLLNIILKNISFYVASTFLSGEPITIANATICRVKAELISLNLEILSALHVACDSFRYKR
jgi:hypothetical protein